MARTKGSGWGAGSLLYQICPECGKKKCYYDSNDYGGQNFKCIWCGKWSYSKTLIRLKYASQVREQIGRFNGRKESKTKN